MWGVQRVLLCCACVLALCCAAPQPQPRAADALVASPGRPLRVPPFWQKVGTARWLSHQLDWGVLSTISARNTTGVGAPFGNPVSYVDSGDGRLYFYVTAMDASMVDVAADARVSLTLSEAQIAGRCDHSSWNPLHPNDPEDPRCGRVVISGHFSHVPANETDAAKKALFARHPEMSGWPTTHEWFVGSIWPLTSVWLIDTFGGADIISPSDYMAAPAPDPSSSSSAAAAASTSSTAAATASPPPATDKVGTARWMSHVSNYAVVSSISSRNSTGLGAPFGNPNSIVDTGDGRIYMYVSNLDATIQDITKDSRVSLTMSQAQIPGHCNASTPGLDPEDPLCARLVLSGHLMPVPANQSDAAKAAIFERHPAMKSWPSSHDFFVATLWPLTSVWLIDFFGGATIIDPHDYLAANPPPSL